MNEVDVLLNLFEQPLMLVNIVKNSVAAVNSALIELTSYTYQELSGNPINSVLISENLNGNNKNGSICLVRKNHPPIEVLVESIDLDNNNCWQLLRISIPGQKKFKNYSQVKVFLNSFLEILASLPANTQDEYIPAVINILTKQFNLNYLSIYQVLESELMLKRISSNRQNDIFPEFIPLSDLNRINDIDIWNPGKRVISEIHKVARINSLAQVISIPFSINNKKMGLVVIGKLEKVRNKKLFEFLKIFVSGFSKTLAFINKQDQLLEQIGTQQKEIIIYKQLFDSIDIGAVIINHSLEIREINAHTENLLGYTCWEIRNLKITDLFTSQDNINQLSMEVFRKGKKKVIDNIKAVKRNGETFPVQVMIMPIESKGNENNVFILIKDNTEKIKYANHIEELEQKATLGNLIAVFAHEVRNPINNIVTGLQLLANLSNSDNSHNEIVDRMQSDCVRLNHLMESVLSYSRPLKMKFESIDIINLLKRLLEKWEDKMKSNDIQSYFHQEENIPFIFGDERLLEQIFTNLISNAIEAMSEKGGTLSVRVEKSLKESKESIVNINISDTGTGIPDEIKQRLFEPFVSLNPKGTGLGLAITKKIVLAHSGEIGVDTFPGGTIFKVTLPAYKGE